MRKGKFDQRDQSDPLISVLDLQKVFCTGRMGGGGASLTDQLKRRIDKYRSVAFNTLSLKRTFLCVFRSYAIRGWSGHCFCCLFIIINAIGIQPEGMHSLGPKSSEYGGFKMPSNVEIFSQFTIFAYLKYPPKRQAAASPRRARNSSASKSVSAAAEPLD